MTEKMILEKIGECVFMEIEDIYDILYSDLKFTIKMENGLKYEVNIKELQGIK